MGYGVRLDTSGGAFSDESCKVRIASVKGLFCLRGKETGGELAFAPVVSDALAAGAFFVAVVGTGAVGAVFFQGAVHGCLQFSIMGDD